MKAIELQKRKGSYNFPLTKGGGGGGFFPSLSPPPFERKCACNRLADVSIAAICFNFLSKYSVSWIPEWP